MSQSLKAIGHTLLESVRDLLPIVAVIAFFQLVVLGQPLPQLAQLLAGLLYVILGLTFFVFGLEMGLFPIGESMAQAFAQKGSVRWLLLFAFALGFGTTVAEPALVAVAGEAAEVAALGGVIADDEHARKRYAYGLRLVVALSVGVAIVVGVLRILRGWPIQYLIIGGYVLVVSLTLFAPPEIIGIAYDSGGVTTSTITVPLVTALGVGLAHAIRGRNPLIDGFGLIALASLTPMIFVLEAARDAGATGATLINQAVGEGVKKTRTFFGLTLETQRDVILFVVEEHMSRRILEKIAEVGEFDSRPGTGIVVQVDVEDALGVRHQIQELSSEVEKTL